MPDLQWNVDFWNSSANWQSGGEEWSDAWGGSEAQWFGSLYPRLHRFLPTGAVLEIAPGFGRWSKFLLGACRSYIGVDLSQESIVACQRIFAQASHARFIENDGSSLAMVADGSCDLVFSFDSLVHVEMEILHSYIRQIVTKLRRDGVAFIHHSNLLPFMGMSGHTHARAGSVSADRVARCIQESEGHVLVQERINWGGTVLHDCLTTFCRAGASRTVGPVVLDNPDFMREADLIRTYHSVYASGLG